jgi:hypothetical protein
MHIDKAYIVIGVALAVALTTSAAFAVYPFPNLDGVTAQPMDAFEMGRAWGTDIMLDIP